MNTASTARVRLAAAIHTDRVMQPLDDLLHAARETLHRARADFPAIFDPRRNRRAGDTQADAR